MSGTITGGKKAAIRNKELYGEDYYSRIGRRGGANGHTGGFASNRELAREAGRKGGKISRRKPGNRENREKSTFFAIKYEGYMEA